MRTVSLPIAQPAYTRDEEQIFRDRVRQEIARSASREALFGLDPSVPTFYGQPHAQLMGDDAAFVVPEDTEPTYLPFPTIQITHPNLVDTGELRAAFDMSVEIGVAIFHPSPGGGAKSVNYTLYASEWDGTNYVTDHIAGAVTHEFNQGWYLYLNALFEVTGENFLRIRMLHDDNVDNIFDLTKSWVSVKQLTVDPAVIGTTRML